MATRLKVWYLLLTAALSPMLAFALTLMLTAQPSVAAESVEGIQGRLASVGWLKKNLARADVVLIDASPAQLHRQQHIPGAIHSDLFTFGPKDPPLAQIEGRLSACARSAATAPARTSLSRRRCP